MTATSSIHHCSRDETVGGVSVAAAAAAEPANYDNDEDYYDDFGDTYYPDYDDYDDFELNGGCRGVTTSTGKQIKRNQQRGNGGGGGGSGTIYSTKHIRAKETQRLKSQRKGKS